MSSHREGSGFRVQGSGFRVQGSGFRVQGAFSPPLDETEQEEGAGEGPLDREQADSAPTAASLLDRSGMSNGTSSDTELGDDARSTSLLRESAASSDAAIAEEHGW